MRVERPVGLSLISLDHEKAGHRLWLWEPEEENKVSGNGALLTQHWDKQRAIWFSPKGVWTVNSRTGELINESNFETVDICDYNLETKKYELKENQEFSKFDYQMHCNIQVGEDIYFLVRYKPYVWKHNVRTGKNECLELPTDLDRVGNYVWGTIGTNDGLNAKGQLHSKDPRVLGDGTQKCFPGSPIMLNEKIYFTNAHGLTYVIDTKTELDESALVSVNDIGESGETWSVNSISYSNGRLFHRSLKELICIEGSN